jgi:hypothetical protein
MTKIFSEFPAAVTFLLVLFFGWQPKKRTGKDQGNEIVSFLLLAQKKRTKEKGSLGFSTTH